MNFPSGISFIITLYNKESFIVDTLESVFKYLKKNNQLIIIDDGSTDKSLEYVKRALQQKNNIDYKVITQENTGPSVAINNCIRYIKYSHVKFLDGDDVLSPNISTFMKNEMDTHNLDLMYGHWIWKSNHTKYKFNTRRYPTKIFKNAFHEIISRGWGGSSNMMIKTSVLKNISGADDKVFVQDFSIPLRVSGYFLKHKKKFIIGLNKTIICCAPKNRTNRIINNHAQTLHDLSVVTLNFLTENTSIDKVLQKKVLNNILRRCWKWKRRNLGYSFFSLSFIKFLLSYVTPNPSTKMVKNEVLKTWVFDENIKRPEKKDLTKKKILIYVGLDLLGDALIKVPLIQSIRARFPNAKITWLAGKGETVFNNSLSFISDNLIDEILENQNIGSRVIELFKPPKIKEEFDIIIDTQKRVLTTLILKKLKTKLFISQTANFLFSDIKPAEKSKTNLTKQLFSLGQLIGASNKLRLPIIKANRHTKELTKKIFHKTLQKKVSICPGASVEKKCWPLKNYIEIAKYLYSKKLIPVFFLGPNELKDYEQLKREVPFSIFPLQNKLIKTPTAAHTYFLSKHSLFGIANDSGCGHLLSISDIPMITLFGPTKASKFQPYNSKINIPIEAFQFSNSTKIENIPVSVVKETINKLLRKIR